MKLRLPHLLLTVLLACHASFTPASAATLIADGVNKDNITQSDRFYDNGKGYYWTRTGDQPYKGAQELYKSTGNSFDFLGDLSEYITATSFSSSAFEPLTNDMDTCWYNASSNIIQYWQSYYGVFYQGTEQLTHGYTYDRKYAQKLGGTQSLKLDMLMYESYPNEGGDFCYLAEWYFLGDDVFDTLKEGAPAGGYYASYFRQNYYDNRDEYMSKGYLGVHMKLNQESSNPPYRDIPGLSAVDGYVKSAFGAQEDENGNLTATETGSLLYLGIGSAAGGHALTCYGFETDESGTVTSLYVTNSDDRLYTLFKVDLVEEADGSVYLNQNGSRWSYSGYSDWKIDELEWIMTPTELKDMYAEYSSRETPLTWTGGAGKWEQPEYIDDLPTASSGWTATAKGKAYDSHYYDDRIVRFDDTATGKDVRMSGSLSPYKVQIDNSSGDYTFTAEEASTLNTEELEKTGTGKAAFEKARIETKNTTVTGGELALQDHSELDISENLKLGEKGCITVTEDSTLSWQDEVDIRGLDAETKAIISSDGTATTYSTDNSHIVITSAFIDVHSENDTSLGNTLVNVTIANNGNGDFTDTSSTTHTLGAVTANSGNLYFMNKGSEGLVVNSITIESGCEIGVYTGNSMGDQFEATLVVNGLLQAGGADSKLCANLTMGSSSILDVSTTDGNGLALGSVLTLNPGNMELSSSDLALVGTLEENSSYALFNGADALTLGGKTYTNALVTLADEWVEGLETTGLDLSNLYLTYSGAADGGHVSLLYSTSASPTVPEPATGTLSLLALAALCARRRRNA